MDHGVLIHLLFVMVGFIKIISFVVPSLSVSLNLSLFS
jgi:hypothetical protein